MKLKERFRNFNAAVNIDGAIPNKRESRLAELKAKLHYRVIDEINFDQLETGSNGVDRHELEMAISSLLNTENEPLSISEHNQIIKEVRNEVLGLGPLEPLLQDPTINDILVNRYNLIYVERNGVLEEVTARFRDESHLRKIIEKIAFAVGRRIDESCPMVDARLEDGSRVNAIIPPLALDGAALSIRKFAVEPLRSSDLIRLGTLDSLTVEVLEAIIKSKLNVLISGGTGTGKTTLLNVMSSFIPHRDRIITIEDSAELQLQQRHVIRLETRPPNLENRGEVSQRDLVRNSLDGSDGAGAA